MISVSSLTVEFSGTPLFNDISFLINPRDRIGLTGKNGAGKSTLLKVLYGTQSYDSGQVAVPKNATVGYLPQQMTVSDTKTVFKETLEAFDEILSLEKEIANSDVVISTAAIPGKPAPKIIRAEAVRAMKPGAVIIDLAAETGGNCELTQAGKPRRSKKLSPVAIAPASKYAANVAPASAKDRRSPRATPVAIDFDHTNSGTYSRV